MTEDKVALSEVLGQLRQELYVARAEGKDAALRLVVVEAEVELQVGITRSDSAGLGVSFWVLTGKTDGAHSRQTTQTIRLKLRPEKPGGGQFDIDGTAPRE